VHMVLAEEGHRTLIVYTPNVYIYIRNFNRSRKKGNQLGSAVFRK
jgi:hypothetical protein